MSIFPVSRILYLVWPVQFGFRVPQHEEGDHGGAVPHPHTETVEVDQRAQVRRDDRQNGHHHLSYRMNNM